MKKTLKKMAIVCIGTILLVLPGFAAKEKPAETNLSPEQAEVNYTKAIEGRTAAILKALALSDTNKIVKVHGIVLAQWRALRAWHDANDEKLKQASKTDDSKAVAEIHVSLKKLHNEFIAKLQENLTPKQIEKVKDKMTYGVVQATYNAYVEIVPNLTDADKNKILELLKEGREEAMDAGSAHEKAAIIKKYKGKINNYLSVTGHNVGKAYKDWGARQKEKAATNSRTKTNSPAK